MQEFPLQPTTYLKGVFMSLLLKRVYIIYTYKSNQGDVKVLHTWIISVEQ